jgi:hypothetical protein
MISEDDDMESRLQRLFRKLDLPTNDKEKLKEYLDHREWGIAYEHLCATIRDLGILIEESDFEEIKDIGKSMDLDEENWSKIEKQTSED